MTTTTPDHRLDAWTARAFAEALDMSEATAAKALEQTVADGLAVRISWRDVVVYVPGDLVTTLTRAEVLPVSGSEKRDLVRQLAARERARRLTARDAKDGRA